MKNPEKLATQGTQDTTQRQAKQKHNTLCIGHHYAQVNTNNINNINNINKINNINNKNKT